MDSDALGSLVCLAPFCLGVLVLAAVAGLLVWAIRRQGRGKDAATPASDRQKAVSTLDRLAAELGPWSATALTDLSTDWDARWSKFGRSVGARGTIPSGSDPKRPAWVAFVLKARSARQPEGQLLARTTAQVLHYELSSEGAAIHVDGTHLGRVQPDGTLLGADDQLAGSAPRPQGGQSTAYPVTLHGRLVAHLTLASGSRRSRKKYPISAAVTLEGAATQEETTWLLALAIFEVIRHGVYEWVRME